MKKTILACLLALSSSSVLAFDYANGDNTTSWDIKGKIKARCVIEKSPNMNKQRLDLTDKSYQESAVMDMWCNTHDRKAWMIIKSENKGVMVNDDDDEIAYKLWVGKHKGLDLSKRVKEKLTSGQGTEVDAITKTFKIKPLVYGREFAGVYKDRITVTVRPQ